MTVTLLDKNGNVVRTMEMKDPGYAVRIDVAAGKTGAWWAPDDIEVPMIKTREFHRTTEPGVFQEV